MAGTSYWEQDCFFAPFDVIIAGGGLAGLWSAYYLKKLDPSSRILVIDRNVVPTGASTRNAGFACFGSLTELVRDSVEMGEEAMLELVSLRYEGLRRIKKVFPAEKIGYEQYGGYELITDKQYATKKSLQDDLAWLNSVLHRNFRVEKIIKLSDKKISSFGLRATQHLVENRLEGQLHSGKLVSQLMQKVQAMGVAIFSQVELKHFEQAGASFLLHTSLPQVLSASQLLLCTNGFSNELVPELGVVPARGQILVTSPIDNLPIRGTFHYDEGYYYFRNVGNRILLGGARNIAFKEEETTSMSVSETIQQELERFLRTVILANKDYTIDYRWSGIMGMAGKKTPGIREIRKGLFAVTGLGGMGVALAPVLAEQVAKKMARR